MIKYIQQNNTMSTPVLVALPAYPGKKPSYITLDEKSYKTLPFDGVTRIFCPPSTFKTFKDDIKGRLSNPIMYAIGCMMIDKEADMDSMSEDWKLYFSIASEWILNNEVSITQIPPVSHNLLIVYVPSL